MHFRKAAADRFSWLTSVILCAWEKELFDYSTTTDSLEKPACPLLLSLPYSPAICPGFVFVSAYPWTLWFWLTSLAFIVLVSRMFTPWILPIVTTDNDVYRIKLQSLFYYTLPTVSWDPRIRSLIWFLPSSPQLTFWLLVLCAVCCFQTARRGNSIPYRTSARKIILTPSYVCFLDLGWSPCLALGFQWLPSSAFRALFQF